MNIITVVLLVVALVLFVLCTLNTPSPPRFNLLAAGLAFCVLAMLAGTVRAQTPQGRYDELREQRAYEREVHHERRRDVRHSRYCREWRARVERHPRLLLPRECWR
jgi:hypothetical protein